LGLGKRIRNPTSNHNDDNHYNCCANYNHHLCADHNDHHIDIDIDNDYQYDYDYHCPWLTSLYGCKGCIFLELGS
jgi:hypothetical protein